MWVQTKSSGSLQDTTLDSEFVDAVELPLNKATSHLRTRGTATCALG